ncbi:2-amino-4-hydroxy-6-hydroxymethyldihydropteridine diphosphokinase [Microcella sp.]|uniref:2-amino-4-hydroxy-6- hydroxymethyldihydropteridine diphosphokinase n=1 Tax=Microcella sp. TaxID=1913979 RepID=UPI00299F7B21|nr:2-amino-4-hydroxy-6-hydroxymethyldihydropteridine diphosphokinase [Microcella sp.]MDX2025591.1 2-amino-4-hydroxy-6-hydroxymethyldihydropteridine diphosphokinase [Microcella sp.]
MTVVHPATAVIALGSNLGDREATLERAVAALDGLPESSILAVSSWHGTVALTVDGLDPEKPAYLNGVAVLQTHLDPYSLLDALRAIEAENGRERIERWGDRTLDLDLIAFDDLEIDSDVLQVPHPRAHERDFVLAPWLEVQPDAHLTGHGDVAALLAALQSGGAE